MCGLPRAWGADAATEAEIRRVQAALQQIDIAQQGVYQQFQMVQELRRSVTGAPDAAGPPTYGLATAWHCEDLQRQCKQRRQKAESYQDELERLYRRFQEREEQKRPPLQRLNEVAR